VHYVAKVRDIAELEGLLGHSFSKRALLEQAVTHRSFANEHASEGIEDNERLEFLGDAVLDLLIGHYLMEAFPHLSEGELSMTRAQMVSEAGLTKVARDLDLGSWLRLGRGEEQSGGRGKPSILSDALEAVVASLYLDGEIEAARTFVRLRFESHTPATPGNGGDHKTRLQELVQSRWKTAPVYELVGESGPDHAKVFEVALIVDGKELSRASGRSKKVAEQSAAALALESL
jgi:ribonuclease-3